MAFHSFITGSRSLTHPTNYHPKPDPKAVEGLGSGAVLYTMHDQAILGHQVRLVDRVVEGSLDKDTFLRNVGHLEDFASVRAEVRGGGISHSEKADLRGEMKKLAGKMTALPQNQVEPDQPVDKTALGLLFDELAHGKVSKTDAVEELHWRADRKYGQVVAERTGVVFGDERGKLRSYLAVDVQTRPDLEEGSPYAAHPDTLKLVRKGVEIFSRLDGNDDGVVDRTEARSLLTNHKNLGLTASEAATLYSRQAQIAEVVEPGPASFERMSLSDLQALLPENGGQADGAVVSDTLKLLESRLADQERRVLAPDLPLYLSPHGPRGDKVAQGLEGSCWLLGVLPAVESEQLKGMLEVEADHYRVRFADGTSEAVAPLNEAERRVYSRGDGAWSGLMEKAVAQKLGRVGLDLKGGLAQDALRLLTGADCQVSFLHSKPADGKPDYRDRANLSRLLETTLGAGGAVFTQVNEADFDPQVSLISDAKHAYTVLSYDAASQTVTLRNPWGKGEKADRDGSDDGNFTMTLTEMAATFSLVVTEKVGAAA